MGGVDNGVLSVLEILPGLLLRSISFDLIEMSELVVEAIAALAEGLDKKQKTTR